MGEAVSPHLHPYSMSSNFQNLASWIWEIALNLHSDSKTAASMESPHPLGVVLSAERFLIEMPGLSWGAPQSNWLRQIAQLPLLCDERQVGKVLGLAPAWVGELGALERQVKEG